MKRFWNSIALLLALLIAPAMAHCSLEAADVVTGAFHCADDASETAPHDDGGCSPCQVESVSVKAEQDGLVVPQPDFQPVHHSMLAETEPNRPPTLHPSTASPAPSSTPAWSLYSRRAAPIRAPSLFR